MIKRSAPMTLTGEIVDISCYKSKGVAGGTGAAHVDCAKMCVLEKGAQVGILTDGDGLFKIWGADGRQTNTPRCCRIIGQQVEITGTEVTLSNNYDVRSFEPQRSNAKESRTPMNARSLVFGSAGVFVLTLVATPVNITAQQTRGAGHRISLTPRTSRRSCSAPARRAIAPAPMRRCRC